MAHVSQRHFPLYIRTKTMARSTRWKMAGKFSARIKPLSDLCITMSLGPNHRPLFLLATAENRTWNGQKLGKKNVRPFEHVREKRGLCIIRRRACKQTRVGSKKAARRLGRSHYFSMRFFFPAREEARLLLESDFNLNGPFRAKLFRKRGDGNDTQKSGQKIQDGGHYLIKTNEN